ncbi:MAG: hypothetical protein V4635_11060 [Bacteroidota bacterium]
MRYFLSLVLLIVTGTIFSQNFRYYRPGQNFASADNGCLLIKNDPASLSKLDQITRYSAFKAVKLTGFDEPDSNLDSLFTMISRSINPEILIIESSDVSDIGVTLSGFNKLEEIQLLNSSFDEGHLFNALRSSYVKTITIQQPDPEIMLDSLHLVPRLNKLRVSNTRVFSSPNKTDKMQFFQNNVSRNVEVTYYGNFFRTEKYPGRPLPNATTPKTSKAIPMSCIRQPIPGIDINDTTYYFSSVSANSFTYESGSILSIDRNAFVTSKGENYAGEVQLFYREFRNPVEIMLSGIPMYNLVNGKTELFKSGGMYEINALDGMGRQLKSRSDTAIKIRFALTDTSANFQFYSLNEDGSWTTQKPAITRVPSVSKKDSTLAATKAVKEYYIFLSEIVRQRADTTDYESRFSSDDYLFTYRKDNMEKARDSVTLSAGRIKSKFRIKYVKQTKDKEIIFTILPARRDDNSGVPAHIKPLLNRMFLYDGPLTKDEFRKTYSRKLKCWDLRLDAAGNDLHFTIKTGKNYMDLNGTPVTLKDDKTYVIQKKGGATLARIVRRTLRREARLFDKKPIYTLRNGRTTRYSPHVYNNVQRGYGRRTEEEAFQYCKKYQNGTESGMDIKAWQRYIKKFPAYDYNSFQYNNDVGNALLKSGLGINNIDCYIHSGAMQPVFVRYDIERDSLLNEYNAMLFKSINGSYPVTPGVNQDYFSGYYFDQHSNYLIRFSQDGYMQVTKPDDLKRLKKGDKIDLAYHQQFNIKGLTTKEITRLILD